MGVVCGWVLAQVACYGGFWATLRPMLCTHMDGLLGLVGTRDMLRLRVLGLVFTLRSVRCPSDWIL